MTTRQRTVTELELQVHVHKHDIELGTPCTASQCMEKLAIERVLDKIEPGDHKVRVAAQGIKFNIYGWRWKALTPKTALANLIEFDNPKTRARVKPHSYKVIAQRTTQITKVSDEQKVRINENRRKRKSEGRGPKKYHSIKERIVGADLGHG